MIRRIVSGNCAAILVTTLPRKRLVSASAVGRADNQEIDTHGGGKIENGRGGIFAHGINRHTQMSRSAPSLSISDMIAFASGSSCHRARPSAAGPPP